MNPFSLILLVVAMATLLLSLMIVRLQRHKTRKIMKALNHMLDRALDGSFTEAHFDESLLSSVESRLYQYLTASLVSARNVSAEKEKIKQLLAYISHQTKPRLLILCSIHSYWQNRNCRKKVKLV